MLTPGGNDRLLRKKLPITGENPGIAFFRCAHLFYFVYYISIRPVMHGLLVGTPLASNSAMMCSLERGNDHNREKFSALLKDVFDGNLKKLRARMVHKTLADAEEHLSALSEDSSVKREDVGPSGHRRLL